MASPKYSVTSKEYRVAELAVRWAVELTKRVHRSFAVEDELWKEDKTVVTVGDLGAQALIISALRYHFPDDTFVGEESAAMLRKDEDLCERVWQYVSDTKTNFPSDLDLKPPSTKEAMMDAIDVGSKGKGGRVGRFWALDPIDGTKTYISGQQYAVCLCLIEGGLQQVAVLGCPRMQFSEDLRRSSIDSRGSMERDRFISDENAEMQSPGYLVTAIKDRGCFVKALNGEARKTPSQIRPSSVTKLASVQADASTSMNNEMHRLVTERLAAQWPPSEIWSQQIKYVAIAIGGYDVMLRIPTRLTHRTAVWDHAGGHLIFEEMGGKVTDMYGRSIDFGAGRKCFNNVGIVAAPNGFHEEVMDSVTAVLQQQGRGIRDNVDTVLCQAYAEKLTDEESKILSDLRANAAI